MPYPIHPNLWGIRTPLISMKSLNHQRDKRPMNTAKTASNVVIGHTSGFFSRIWLMFESHIDTIIKAVSEYMEVIMNKLDKLTLEEKASLMSGANFWNTKAFDHADIKGIMLTDGPHGIRK